MLDRIRNAKPGELDTVLLLLELAMKHMTLYHEKHGKNRVNDVTLPLIEKSIRTVKNTMSSDKVGSKWAL